MTDCRITCDSPWNPCTAHATPPPEELYNGYVRRFATGMGAIYRRLPRRDWLLGIAAAVSAAADCSRRRVGAVIYNPQTYHLLSTGYNGRAAGLPGCLTEGACPRGQLSYEEAPSGNAGAAATSYLGGKGACDAIHAEDNALRRAREREIDVEGAHIAVTAEPCDGCYALLRHYGIVLVIWPGGERSLA